MFPLLLEFRVRRRVPLRGGLHRQFSPRPMRPLPRVVLLPVAVANVVRCVAPAIVATMAAAASSRR